MKKTTRKIIKKLKEERGAEMLQVVLISGVLLVFNIKTPFSLILSSIFNLFR